MSNFERLRSGHSPVIFGDGEQSLDYVHVNDVVRGLIALSDPLRDGICVNFSSGVGRTINDLTTEMTRIAGWDGPVSRGAPDWTHGSRRVGARSEAERLLGWTPEVGLADGLESVWREGV